MTDILVKPRELRQTAEDIRARAKKIEQATDAVSGVVLGAGFRLVLSGNRADKLFSRFRQTKGTLETFDDLLIRFAEELREIADKFALADQVKKKIVYLINGINYDGSKSSFEKLTAEIKKIYGAEVDVRVVDAHPYDSNLLQYKTNLKGTDYGGLLTPLDWITGAGASTINKGSEVILSGVNTIYGIGQVANEYITGGSAQSEKVYKWIQQDLEDLRKQGLINQNDVDIVLFGHSGGGAIATNIVDDIEEKLGYNVSGIITAGSPMANYDHALNYAETIIDMRAEGDWFATLGPLGPVRSDETRNSIGIGMNVGGLLGGPSGKIVGGIGAVTIDDVWQDQSDRIIYAPIAGDRARGVFDDHGYYWVSSEAAGYIGQAFGEGAL